ncbi:MAG: hypothetical protein AB7F99_09055 [Vicinamibacterales bacterium]
MTRSIKSFFVVTAVAAATASCGDVVRQGAAPVMLVIDQLEASSGNTDVQPFSNTLFSDVLTNVTSPAPCSPEAPCGTIFADLGRVTLRLIPKDITGIEPSTNNAVTIQRYRVKYARGDGRNTLGVDIPYGFDGAATGTVQVSGTTQIGFELVRHVAKEESPLVQLISNPNIISTIAEVTFFGRDQVGNEISVTGFISVNFGNFGL